MLYIGIDLGGTNIAAGTCREDGTIIEKFSVPTPKTGGADALTDTLALCAAKLIERAGGEKVAGIGVGAPGACDVKGASVWKMPNIVSEPLHIGDCFEQRFGIRAFCDNDANCALAAEYLFGAAKEKASALMITLGTGVGGAYAEGGSILRGRNGLAGEFGHMVIKEHGLACGCGRKGCFEQYASASALKRKALDEALRDPEGVVAGIIEKNGHADGKTLFEVSLCGDERASALVEEYAEDLACGMINLINIFQPEIFLVGGGVCASGEELFSRVRRYIEKEDFSRQSGAGTIVAPAALGNDAGIIGAAFIHKMF